MLAQSFGAAATLPASRFGGEAPKARTMPESAATVITGRVACTDRECAVDAPDPVGGDECVRAWLMRSRRDARSSDDGPSRNDACGALKGTRESRGRPIVCARPWPGRKFGVECEVKLLGADCTGA